MAVPSSRPFWQPGLGRAPHWAERWPRGCTHSSAPGRPSVHPSSPRCSFLRSAWAVLSAPWGGEGDPPFPFASGLVSWYSPPLPRCSCQPLERSALAGDGAFFLWGAGGAEGEGGGSDPTTAALSRPVGTAGPAGRRWRLPAGRPAAAVSLRALLGLAGGASLCVCVGGARERQRKEYSSPLSVNFPDWGAA